MKPVYAAMLVIGVLFATVGLALTSLGLAAGWVSLQQQDGGYLATGTARYASDGNAIISDDVTVSTGGGAGDAILPEGVLGLAPRAPTTRSFSASVRPTRSPTTSTASSTRS